MAEELGDESVAASTPRRRGWNAYLTLGVVGVLVIGGAFAGGVVSGSASIVPVATPTPEPRTVPTEQLKPSSVRTCSVAKLAKARQLGTETVLVTDDKGALLFDSNAADPVPMGSVMKLITAVVALDNLGAKARLTTRVVEGSTEGTVILVGGGDPTISAGGSTVYPGAPTMTELATETVTSYTALHPDNPVITTVLVDLTMFPVDDAWNPNWPVSERTIGYQPLIVPLMVDGDRANPGLQTSPRSTDPAGRAAAAFIAALQQAGNGAGDVEVDYQAAPNNAKELASVSSQPVSTLIAQMLPTSDNTLAELLMRASSVEAGFDGSADSIKQLVLGSLTTNGVDMSGGRFEDGSGESNKDLIPPRAIVDLVRVIFSDGGDMDIIRNALPIAGQSGTLATRFVGPAAVARGHVQGKTGWINGVYALAGQISIRKSNLHFVVVARGKVDSTAMTAIDNLVAGIYRCGDNLASF